MAGIRDDDRKLFLPQIRGEIAKAHAREDDNMLFKSTNFIIAIFVSFGGVPSPRQERRRKSFESVSVRGFVIVRGLEGNAGHPLTIYQGRLKCLPSK